MKLSCDKLFSIIRCGMGLETPDFRLTEEEIQELKEFGKKQSVLSILYYGLKSMHLPSEQIHAIEKACSEDLYRFILHDVYLEQVGTALNLSGIPYIFLKGAVIRNLYPKPEMRTSCDIDILVKEENLAEAINAIEEKTDLKMVKKSYHDVIMVDNGQRMHLELHFNIKENNENLDTFLSRAWEYANPPETGSRYAFTPEFQIFHVIAHMCHHFLNGGVGIRPFIDLWLLRNKTEYCEDTVMDMCRQCKILKFYEECCNLSDVWMENAKRTDMTSAMEEFCLSGGVFGTMKFKNAGRQRHERGWKYLLRRIFPPVYQVKEFYRDESGKEHIAAYYYLKRLFIWFSKERREDLKKQTSDILSTDKQYMDQAADLFKQLEL